MFNSIEFYPIIIALIFFGVWFTIKQKVKKDYKKIFIDEVTYIIQKKTLLRLFKATFFFFLVSLLLVIDQESKK